MLVELGGIALEVLVRRLELERSFAEAVARPPVCALVGELVKLRKDATQLFVVYRPKSLGLVSLLNGFFAEPVVEVAEAATSPFRVSIESTHRGERKKSAENGQDEMIRVVDGLGTKVGPAHNGLEVLVAALDIADMRRQVGTAESESFVGCMITFFFLHRETGSKGAFVGHDIKETAVG